MFFQYGLQAQQRCKKVALNQKITDTLTIIPESFQFQTTDTTLKIQFNFSKNEAIWKSKIEYTTTDSILVCYQTLPFSLTQKYQQRESVDTLTFFITPLVPLDKQTEKREEIITTDSIQKTGAIYRGLAIGNQQNAFVNSALNLQLEGKITPDVTLKALLNDQQVPFQPEGNTQQVQQLDRILIELQSKTTILQAGDIIMQNKNSEFLRYYKNVQGVQIETQQTYRDSSKSVTSFGVALAKGRFASVAINPLEGVQGPYRLRGANNERFIVVIANTEKIYVDGKLLRRGFDADYVIDYNLAEITFNPNILITQYTRIRVDYEYTERNYSRTNLHASHFQEYKKATIFGQYYAETDNPRNPLAIQLSDNQKLQLAQIGDDINQAFLNTADSVGYTNEAILYEKKDTLVNSGIYPVFIYSKNPQKAFWQVAFTDVGVNKGNYILTQTLQNGRIYEWVEPLQGIPQGNYEPISLVPLPQKRQLFTIGGAWKPNKYEKIYLEMAFSKRDLNRFSSLDDQDNNGFALKTTIEQKDRYNWKKYQFSSKLSYELNNPTFLPIDRFRNIEFNRDWNLNLDTLTVPEQRTEHIGEIQISLKKDNQNFISTSHTYRNRQNKLSGFQNQFNFSQVQGKWQLKANAFFLNSEQNNLEKQNSTWQRLNAEVAHQSKKLVKGYTYFLDKNVLQNISNDSITFSAMNFDEHKVFVKTTDSSKIRFTSDYSYRTDNQPTNGELKLRTIAQTIQSSLQTKVNAIQSLKLLATYRNIQNFIINSQNEENLMGRLEWTRQLWKKNVRSELIWQNTTSRELQREFSYIQVPTGQGTHTWRDDNNNNIAELNEFYLAINPDERQYAKIFTPTDTYIKAFFTDINYRLNLQTPTEWSKQKGVKYILSKFSLNGSALLRRKTTEQDFLKRIIPLSNIENQNILSVQESIRSILFFNRGNSQFGADLNFNKSSQKQLLTNGFETRGIQEIGFTGRKNLGKYWNGQIQIKNLQTQNQSDFLLNRNFKIDALNIQPQIAYQPSNNWRLSIAFLQNNKVNQFGNEKANLQEWSSELRWSKPSVFVLSAQIRLVDIRFTGETASPVAYEMLEALQTGRNWIWTATYQQRLANGLQINILYNGRKMPNQSNIIHFGQVQAGVLF
ncbi:MAG: hypothetical protein MUC49_04190 [Raineya sp.]|jgi:hypothetical protein|nr:hypothetical protein [Raineya sp.]